MLDSLRDSFEMLREQVWFFRFFLIMGVVCVYRVLLHFVLRTNHCPNPFCSKCLSSGSVRGRAINHIKKDNNNNDEENSLNSIILNNLVQHDRGCRKNDEKPTVYFHRGLSSGEIKLPDQQILIDHYDELRQEMVKFFQENDQIQWTHFYLYKNGEENKTNCETLPKLFEILHELPNAICINGRNCLFGNCYLTRLTSDKNDEDEKRNGLTNCSIRMHFGLICDEQSSAYVFVNKQKRLPIENKRTTLYNDALEHSIQNPQGKQQVFLTIDFWHPDLSPDMRKQLTSIFHTDLA
jgi:hypothetical protein